MRVGIDARELGGRPTGVGRYLRELIVRWHADPRCDGAELLLYSPDDRIARVPEDAARGAAVRVRHLAGHGGTTWQQHALRTALRADGVDVAFSPAYTAPLLTGIPSVVAIHDVSFAAHPEWFGWRHGLRLRTLARWSAHQAHTVVTLTDASASEIVRHLRVPRARIRVIPLAVDYHDSGPALMGGATAAPVVLFVGSIFERRHLPLLVAGVARARQVRPDLVLEVIGENRTAPRLDLQALAARHGMADAIRLRDYVSDDALATAYAGAGVFAFLSEYEGFGLTPLEAMRHGVPVVVLDTPVAREVYGEGAVYVRRGDAQGVADAILALLDPVARATQRAAGLRTVDRYHWADTARDTWAALRDAAQGAGA